MFGFIPFKAWLAAGCVAAVLAGGAYLRWDATQDAKAAAKAAQDAADKKTLERINESISTPRTDDDIRRRLRELAE